MKLVKLSELKNGDLFIHEGRYYEVLDTTPIKVKITRDGTASYIKVKCFMSPKRRHIGTVNYPSIDVEVTLCEPTSSN